MIREGLRGWFWVYGSWITRRMTVTIKARPDPMATSRSRSLSMVMLLTYFMLVEINSDVIRRIIAVTASQRPMSEAVSGKFIVRLHGFGAKLGLFGCRGKFGFFGLLSFCLCFGL